MAHHIIQWRHVGLAALIVVAAHMALGLLFMMSRREETTVESPVLTEIGFVPPVLIRKGASARKAGAPEAIGVSSFQCRALRDRAPDVGQGRVAARSA